MQGKKPRRPRDQSSATGKLLACSRDLFCAFGERFALDARLRINVGGARGEKSFNKADEKNAAQIDAALRRNFERGLKYWTRANASRLEISKNAYCPSIIVAAEYANSIAAAAVFATAATICTRIARQFLRIKVCNNRDWQLLGESRARSDIKEEYAQEKRLNLRKMRRSNLLQKAPSAAYLLFNVVAANNKAKACRRDARRSRINEHRMATLRIV